MFSFLNSPSTNSIYLQKLKEIVVLESSKKGRGKEGSGLLPLDPFLLISEFPGTEGTIK